MPRRTRQGGGGGASRNRVNLQGPWEVDSSIKRVGDHRFP